MQEVEGGSEPAQQQDQTLGVGRGVERPSQLTPEHWLTLKRAWLTRGAVSLLNEQTNFKAGV